MRTIDIKFHVVSIAAVFIALGMGILIGGNTRLLGGANNLMEKQDALIESLEAKYKELDRREREFRQVTAHNEAETKERLDWMENRAAPDLSRGALSGFRYGLLEIQAAEAEPNGVELTEFLKTAGAEAAYRVVTGIDVLLDVAKASPETFLDDLARDLVWCESEPDWETKRLERERNGGREWTPGAALTALKERGAAVEGDLSRPVDGAIVLALGEPAADAATALLGPLQVKVKGRRAVQATGIEGVSKELSRAAGQANLNYVRMDGSLRSKIQLLVQMRDQARELALTAATGAAEGK